MKLNRFVVGAGPNLAASEVAGAVFPKTLASPAFLELNSDLIVSYLLNGSSQNMVVSGTPGAPVIFQYVVPVGKYFAMVGVNIVIVDAAITPLKFGGLASPLTNGIIWRIVDQSDNVVIKFHAGTSIVANYEFAHLAGAEFIQTASQDMVQINWRATNFGTQPLLKAGWKIQVLIRDNLAGLDKFEASVFGLVMDPIAFSV